MDYDVVALQMQILISKWSTGYMKSGVIEFCNIKREDTTVNIFDLLKNYEWIEKFEQGSELELQTNWSETGFRVD